MDDQDFNFPNEDMLSCLDMTNTPSNYFFNIDEFLDETNSSTQAQPCNPTHSCTHAHACNPPGPDKSHTHTCIHVHTQIMPTQSDDTTQDSLDKKPEKRPLGNREAVRKYREKKKAKTAVLEDEVVRLRAMNQQLMKRLQNQAFLEAEISRLKCLLVDIRGRIDGEIGSFPYKKTAVNPSVPDTYVMNPCNMQGNNQLYCQGSEGPCLHGQSLDDCGFDSLHCLGDQNENLQCLRNQNSGQGIPECGIGRGVFTGNI